MAAVENPYVFPHEERGNYEQHHSGLTLRDYIAARAPITEQMALSCYGADDGVDMSDEPTRLSFFAVYAMMQLEFADAMLAERRAVRAVAA